MAPRTLFVVALALVGAVGCSGDSSPSNPAQALGGPALSGVVLDYTDTLTRDVPVSVVGGTSGQTVIDGRLLLGNTSGNQVLRVGDSVKTPTLLVPYTSAQGGTFLERPVFLPSLGSGIAGTLPDTVAAVTTLSGSGLAGVTLTLSAGTAISNKPQAEVQVLPLSASRLPVGVRGGSDAKAEPRVAYLVEPHGVQFSPAATLRVPRLLPASAGPFEIRKINLQNGEWTLVQGNVSPVGDSFEIPVDEGTAYCVVTAGTTQTVTVTGRVVSGSSPVEGYRAECWNRVSDPTGPDGTFEINDVPADFGVYLVRVSPAEPGATHRPEVVLTTTTNPTLGDVVVTARTPDRLRPSVRSTAPRDDQTRVSRSTQVVVTFSEAIDPAQLRAYKVTGPKGDVAGTFGFDNAFAVRFRPTERLDPSARYTILIDTAVQDLAGNLVEDDKISFSFTTIGGAPDPPPTDTLAFSIAPLTAAAGDTIQIPGRNYTGGTSVSFGGFQGVVRTETSDLIEVEVPNLASAGNSTVTLQAGSLSVGSLQPLVLDLRGSVAQILSGATPDSPLTFLRRLQPPPQVVIDGSNLSGTTLTVDGVGIAAVDSAVLIGGQSVTTGRILNLPTPAPSTLVSGPVVVRGSNALPGRSYRFVLIRED